MSPIFIIVLNIIHRKLADEELPIGLAVSLHQATNEKRSSLMPVNDRYNIEGMDNLIIINNQIIIIYIINTRTH